MTRRAASISWDLIVFLILNIDPCTPRLVELFLDSEVSIRGDDRLLKVDAVRAGDDIINRGLHRATEVGRFRHMMSQYLIFRVVRISDRCVALDRPPAVFQYYPPPLEPEIELEQRKRFR